MASIKNLNELYEETYELFKYTQLTYADIKKFKENFSEAKQLKEKALNSSVKSSKDFFLKQSHLKLQTINNELLNIKKTNELNRYKDEVEKLKKLFKDKKLSAIEKENIAKNMGKMNNFNINDWMVYLKNNSKIMGDSFSQSINSIFLSGF
ncbi:hypothetical protein [Aliarcobacter cryaerophilus]|uniref:hypothetical protein n=1 Tax=Aliarcobacter cryaerophilus TaxID=28198 RepID=UPI0016548686|nr:hypothetical protein [Aliarcobacter cryaerophilus]MCT7482800.1 hypothetical protein [Aliarcobacter cryaerophilus]QNM93097.1 hypothetical protein HOO33_04510 [Aliarcobacter cryaerophilus]